MSTYDILGVRLGARFDKLNFLLPVDEGTDGRDDNDGDHNSETLDPSYKQKVNNFILE